MSSSASDKTDLSGKVAVITGCTGDVGSAVAVLLSRCGAQVVVTDTDRERVLAVARRCDQSALHSNKWQFLEGKWVRVQTSLPFVLNYSDVECHQLIDCVVSRFARIDLLVIIGQFAKTANLSGLTSGAAINLLDIYDQTMAAELRPLILLTHLSVPFLESSQGNIINISDTTAIKAEASLLAKCMAKSSAEMFAKCLSLELGPKKVRINSITHSKINANTDHINGLEVNQELMDAFLQRLQTSNPLGALFTPEDVANAVLYLASDAADFMNGVNLVVTGGSGL